MQKISSVQLTESSWCTTMLRRRHPPKSRNICKRPIGGPTCTREACGFSNISGLSMPFSGATSPVCGNAALNEMGRALTGRTLQVACVYGDFTPKLAQRLAPAARLDVIDVAPIQLDNLRRKING